MSGAMRIFAGELRKHYLGRVARLQGAGTVEEAFAAWLLGTQSKASFDIRRSASVAVNKAGGGRAYRDIATLGYTVALSPESKEFGPPFSEGLTWLIGRKPFSQSVPSFEVDGLALLGIALGAMALDHLGALQWLATFLARSASSRLSHLDHACVSEVASVIDRSELAPMPVGEDFAIFRVAFQTRRITRSPSEDDESTAIRQILESNPSEIDEIECAIHLRILEWLVLIPSGEGISKPSVDHVVSLLERVPSSLRRWRWDEKSLRGASPVRWKINDEYHVQDLLWLILAPIFTDLEDEENLPSVGHKHPRCDLGIPSLHLIVEVKFIRRASDFAKVTGEIAEDHSLYLASGSSYSKIIAFVWDDTASSDQHAELRQALGKMSGIAGAIVVSRPSRMREGTP